MLKPPEHVEIPEENELRRERFARILAVLIVIATLGVASVEYLHSIAEKNAEAAGIEAQSLSIKRQGEIVRANDASRANLDVYAYAQQQRTQEGNSFQEYLSNAVKQGSTEAQLLQLEQDRWSALAALTGQLTTVKDTGPASPGSDAGFPNVLVAQGQKDADRLYALGDAQDQLRSDWLGRTGLLSVILTLLAVAIYLFGLSLTLQARIRRWLVGLGIVLVGIGGVSTVVLQFSNPQPPSEAAADSYAEGVYALNTFYTRPGNEGLQEALRDFSTAIQQRPRFAQAFLQRSKVQFLLGSPQKSSPIVSITSAAALRAEGDDLQQAFNLGLRNKDLLNNLAANRLLLALTQNQSGDINPALSYLDDALKLDPNEPLLYYNKGIALLAQGNASQAQQQYRLAVDHTLYTDVAKRTLRSDPAIQEGYVAGALTPLDLLGHYRSDLTSQIDSMKELIVNGVDRSEKPQGQTATVNISSLDVFPAELQWHAKIDGVPITSTSVSTEWYYQDPQKLGWSVIDSMSGSSPVAATQTTQTNDNTVYHQVCDTCQPDDYFLINSSLKTFGQCLQPGQYKVEIYVNGHLIASKAQDDSYPGFDPQRMPEVALDFCHPKDWQPNTTNKYVFPGFSELFTTPDGSAGAFFMRFQNPGVTYTSDTEAQTIAAGFRKGVFSGSLISTVLPGGAAPTIDCGSPNAAGTNQLPWGPLLDAACNRQSGFFLGLKGANEAWYTYAGGELHVGSGFTSDGAIIVGFTFAPSSAWQSSSEPLPDQVFDSIVTTQQ